MSLKYKYFSLDKQHAEITGHSTGASELQSCSPHSHAVSLDLCCSSMQWDVRGVLFFFWVLFLTFSVAVWARINVNVFHHNTTYLHDVVFPFQSLYIYFYIHGYQVSTKASQIWISIYLDIELFPHLSQRNIALGKFTFNHTKDL